MGKRTRANRAEIETAIRAAQSRGLQVIAVRADGLVLVEQNGEVYPFAPESRTGISPTLAFRPNDPMRRHKKRPSICTETKGDRPRFISACSALKEPCTFPVASLEIIRQLGT